MIKKLTNKIFRILILRNPLDIIFGRIFYGNDSTHRKNIQSKLAIKRNKIDKLTKSIDVVEYFKKYGFTKVNRIISLTENIY